MFGLAAKASNAYRNLATESSALGADRHQLICLLFSGTLSAIGQARAALAKGDIGMKAQASSKAIRLIDEGLKVAVNRSVGEMGESLYQLYEYCARRLLQGHLKHDDAAYAEVARLIHEIDTGWRAISPTAKASTSEAKSAIRQAA
jgi:flagellar protein FliS